MPMATSWTSQRYSARLYSGEMTVGGIFQGAVFVCLTALLEHARWLLSPPHGRRVCFTKSRLRRLWTTSHGTDGVAAGRFLWPWLPHFRDTEMQTKGTATYFIPPYFCAKVSVCMLRSGGRLHVEHRHGTVSPAAWQVDCRRDTAGLG